MTKDDLLEVVAILTCKNMALEEKIEKIEESYESQITQLEQRIESYKRIIKRNLEGHYHENDEEDE